MEEIKRRFMSRFGLSDRPTEQGFFAFFGLGAGPASRPLECIAKEFAGGALIKDAQAIASDFDRVFKRESELIDVESQQAE